MLSRNKNLTIKKRDTSPDIIKIEFREGVGDVNRVTAYLLT